MNRDGLKTQAPVVAQCCRTIFFLYLALPISVRAADRLSWPEVLARVLAADQTRFKVISRKYATEPAMAAYQQRCDRVAALTRNIGQIADELQSNAAFRLLQDIGPMVAVPTISPSTNAAASPLQLLMENRLAWNDEFDFPERMADSDRNFLYARYAAINRAAIGYVWHRTNSVYITTGQVDDALAALGLILPFLGTSDDEWMSTTITAIPEWMRSDDALAAAETFALRAFRLETAWQFHTAKENKSDVDKILYLQGAGQRMVRALHDEAAFHCFERAVALARIASRRERLAELLFALADVTGRLGHPSRAVALMDELLRMDTPSYGRAALARVQFLSQSGDFGRVVEDGLVYASDRRCSEQLPTILLAVWTATRHRGDRTQEAELQAQFLDHFPTHPQAAQLHFAAGVSALMAGEYDDADRRFTVVATDFPDSPLALKAKLLRERLRRR